MLLYVLRHADADTEAESDDLRRLSSKGQKQARAVGKFCQQHGLVPALVLASPLARAHETAVKVAEETGVEVTIAPWLASGMTAAVAIEELQAYKSHTSLMITGHEPDLSALVASLVGIPSNALLHL